MGEITQRLAANLKTLRTSRKMTQGEVALAVSISKRQYQRLEAGVCLPAESTIEKLCATFDADLAELVAR